MKLEQKTGTDYPMTARIRYVLEYIVVKISDSEQNLGTYSRQMESCKAIILAHYSSMQQWHTAKRKENDAITIHACQ